MLDCLSQTKGVLKLKKVKKRCTRGIEKLLIQLYISIFAVFIKKVNKISINLTKHIEYTESEFRSFEFLVCKFSVVYILSYILKLNDFCLFVRN